VRLGGLDWLVMSSKLQICASPCLDQMLHQIQWRQNLPPMCSTMTQPSRPAVHHVRQSKQAGLAQFPEAVNLSDCPMSRQGLANSLTFHTNHNVSRFQLLDCASLSATAAVMLQGTSWAAVATANKDPVLHASICGASIHKHINIPVGLRAHFTYPLTNGHITYLLTKGLITYLLTKGPK
jgi:hypothetical protein